MPQITPSSGSSNFCKCGEEAIVQVTDDKVPLCPEHLEEWLKGIKENLNRIKENLDASRLP